MFCIYVCKMSLHDVSDVKNMLIEGERRLMIEVSMNIRIWTKMCYAAKWMGASLAMRFVNWLNYDWLCFPCGMTEEEL